MSNAWPMVPMGKAAHAKMDRLKELQAGTAAELDALLPSILDKALKGEM